MKFFDEIAAAGWDPTDPSHDCVIATSRPAMPEHLSEEDRLGIHRKLLSIDLYRRFPDAFGDGNDDEEGRGLGVVAALHSLRAAGRDLTTLTREEFAKHIRAADAWEQGRFKPADLRFEVAVEAGLGPQDISPRFMEYEPALTYHTVLYAMGWTDWEGNRKAAVAAIRMAEERGVIAEAKGGVSSDLKGMVMTDGDVGDMIGLLLSKNPEQNLFHVTKEGKFRLGAEEGRDALESVVGPIEHVRQKDSEPLPEGFDPTAADERTLADESAEKELAALVRDCIQERRAGAASDSVEALVADNFERLKRGETSARALADRAGMPRATVDREVAALRAALAKRFGSSRAD